MGWSRDGPRTCCEFSHDGRGEDARREVSVFGEERTGWFPVSEGAGKTGVEGSAWKLAAC
jgi:hypothetical protein